MRMWMMLGVGALMLVSVVLPSGAWGASLEDVRKEMANSHMPFQMKPTVWVPLYGSGATAVSWADLCISGDRLRRQGVEGPSADVGKVPADKQYDVLVYATNYGDTVIAYHRDVTLPDCK